MSKKRGREEDPDVEGVQFDVSELELSGPPAQPVACFDSDCEDGCECGSESPTVESPRCGVTFASLGKEVTQEAKRLLQVCLRKPTDENVSTRQRLVASLMETADVMPRSMFRHYVASGLFEVAKILRRHHLKQSMSVLQQCNIRVKTRFVAETLGFSRETLAQMDAKIVGVFTGAVLPEKKKDE
jgi:hypothetical protein